MAQSNHESRCVPGELRPASLLLAVALFVALDFTAYWAVGTLFRNKPSQQKQTTSVEPIASECEKRLDGVERSASTLSNQIAAAKSEVGLLEQNMTDLKKTTVSRGDFERLEQELSRVRAKLGTSHPSP